MRILLLLALATPMLAQTVPTSSGPIRGTQPGPDVRAYLGIPYAAPPVGPLRWQPPQPPVPWQAPRDTAGFGPHCFQSVTYPDMVFHDPGPSEDCLTLNVWTPAKAKPGAKLPVMVWIYGGGFLAGSTSEARQNGQFLAAGHNVIVVSMNYRLGIFGFFTHPELAAESTHGASGNYGLLDQAAALAWVHRNIAAFGGDPANITLFGESAGSFSVSAQMASPIAQGLIARAIGESGAAFPAAMPGYPPHAEAELRDQAFAKAAYGTGSLAALRKLPPETILKAITAPTATVPRFGPVIDGYFLADSVPALYAAGKQAHIPLLAGWNADEGQAPADTTIASFSTQATTDFGDKAKEFLAAYLPVEATAAQAHRAAVDYAGDRFIAYGTWRWLEAQVATGRAPVYRYLFALGNPGDDHHQSSSGAFHSDDIEYVFGTLDSRPGATIRPEDRALCARMQAYWTNFARTGDPNTPGLPTWPTYNPSTGWQLLRLDAVTTALPDSHRARYLFLQQAWTR